MEDSVNADLIDDLARIEMDRLGALADLSTRFVVDRTKQDPTSIDFDPATGQLLGALSEAARAAQAVIAQKIIQKGGEPGWGP